MEDDDQIKIRLQQLHNLYVNRNMDTNTLRFWVTSICSHERTFEDFTSAISKSDEFKSYLYKKFCEFYHDRIGADTSSTEFDSFRVTNQDNPVDEIIIHKYIYALPAFSEKYHKIIKSIFTGLQKDCSESIIDHYMTMIYNTNRFDRVTLVEWIECATHSMHTAEITEVTPHVVVPMKALDESKIASFEQIFNRPMYVQEYFKYIHNATSRVTDWAEIFAEHESNFSMVSEIFLLYTSMKLDEYYYIKTYLYEVDSQRFLPNVVDSIIESHMYEKNMKITIFQRYKELFGDSLDNMDMLYIFTKVKAIKLNMFEEDITDILHQFKKETNIIVSHIFKIYNKVLERFPDVFEIETTLAKYRTDYAKGYDTIDITLEKTLMGSLEFHDIIKKNIKTIYLAEKKADILPSTMFALLNSTVSQLDSMENLTEVIRAFIV